MANSNSAIIEVSAILTGATATGAGDSVRGVGTTKTYNLKGATTAGAGAATVQVQGSITGAAWVTIGTISLTLATTASADGFTSEDRYPLIRGNVTAISGTGASVDLTAAH